ncbi:hypothetical protein D3C81_1811150 [compost metagenome]
MLQQQAVRLAVAPLGGLAQGREHLLEHGQFRRLRRAEQRHQQHALQPVHGDMLEPRPAPPAAVEQAPGLVGYGAQGGNDLLLQGGYGIGIHG